MQAPPAEASIPGIASARSPARTRLALAGILAAGAHINLGNALDTQGRTREAIVHYEAALRLEPGNAAAHFNLAVALLRLPGRGDEARAHLETALRLDPGNDRARQVMERLRGSPP